jgi:ABC-type transporter Mla subunit MlaD
MLPGRFPTVEEFRKTVGALQQDIGKNSSGIQQLGEQQRKDSARLATLVSQTERRLTRRMKRQQTFSIIAALIPLAVGFVDQRL